MGSLKQLAVVITHHRRARSGRRDYEIPHIVFKDPDEVFRHGARFRAIARVEGNLPAARLRVVEADFDTQTPQRCDHRFANVGIELVDQTGDEQGNSHYPFATDLPG